MSFPRRHPRSVRQFIVAERQQLKRDLAVIAAWYNSGGQLVLALHQQRVCRLFYYSQRGHTDEHTHSLRVWLGR